MFLMGIFWYHLYDMSNYKLCNLDTYNHNFGSSVEKPKNRYLKIRDLETQKIQATYFKIYGLYFEIYALCFETYGLCFF